MNPKEGVSRVKCGNQRKIFIRILDDGADSRLCVRAVRKLNIKGVPEND